jgi:hypothetical protein
MWRPFRHAGGLCLNIFISCAVVTGTCRLDKLGIDVLGKIQTGAGSPFGLPFTTKYLKYFKETVSRSLPASIAQPSNQNLAGFQFPTAAVIAVVCVGSRDIA